MLCFPRTIWTIDDDEFAFLSANLGRRADGTIATPGAALGKGDVVDLVEAKAKVKKQEAEIKARAEAEAKIKIAEIEAQTKLDIARIEAGIDLQIAAMKPPPQPKAPL